MTKTQEQAQKKKKAPLSANERSRLAYKRKTQDNTYIKVMLPKEIKLKLNLLVADSGVTQSKYLEQLITSTFDTHATKK